MTKKISALLLCLLMVLCVTGCKKYKDTSSEANVSEENETIEPTYYTNPLTGVSDYTENIAANRPVAIMINNIKTAQSVQTGVAKADIVYETEVEGGITRLMAVFQDVSSVSQIGSVRSARYPYVDLALGHNAFYIHCGQDPTYCAPHLKDIEDISIDSGKFGKRIQNGLSSEHTLYTFGDELWKGIKSTFKNTTQTNAQNWQNFAEDEETITFDGLSCQKVTVPFSNSYSTSFTYDAQSGKYTRLSGANVLKDYKTGETVNVKNVFVLLTTINDYPDGKHRKVDLVGGDGYYITNGTYTFIKWSKGASTSSFKFTDTDGNPLKVNQGNSWVCIADKRTSNPSIQ